MTIDGSASARQHMQESIFAPQRRTMASWSARRLSSFRNFTRILSLGRITLTGTLQHPAIFVSWLCLNILVSVVASSMFTVMYGGEPMKSKDDPIVHQVSSDRWPNCSCSLPMRYFPHRSTTRCIVCQVLQFLAPSLWTFSLFSNHSPVGYTGPKAGV